MELKLNWKRNMLYHTLKNFMYKKNTYVDKSESVTFDM